MTETSLFSQEEIWGRLPDPYQEQVVADVLQMLPQDVRSVLDVGCGDGFLCRALPAGLRVVGLDGSQAALKHFPGESCLGSVGELPFPDRSFDLVMANDVFEHLSEGEFEKGLAELERVAARYVLLTSPYGEQLQSRYAKCAECHAAYHINWHQRRFTLRSMLGLFREKLQVREIRFSGDSTRPPHDPTVAKRHELGHYQPWQHAVCPNCRSSRQPAAATDSLLVRSMDAYRATHWCSVGSHLDRSEVMGLFSREDGPRSTVPEWTEGSISLLDVDFSNRLQVARPDFAPGSSWVRFTVPAGCVQVADGVRVQSEGDRSVVVPIRVPVRVVPGDAWRLEVSPGSSSGGTVQVYSLDGLSVHHRSLGSVEVFEGGTVLEAPVDQTWWPDRFGTAIEIHVRGDVLLHAFRYLPAGAVPQVPALMLRAGHNVVQMEENGIVYSWGLKVEAAGSYPKPRLGLRIEDEEERLRGSLSWDELASVVDTAYVSLRRQHAEVGGIVAEKERRIAEQAGRIEEQGARIGEQGARIGEQAEHIAELEERIAELEERVEEQERSGAGVVAELHARMGIKGSYREFVRSVKCRVMGPELGDVNGKLPAPWQPFPTAGPDVPGGDGRRVLVLSNMFPQPGRPGSGPFVLEQVKFLRELQGLDVRVLVGQPYWMNGVRRQPLSFWKLNRQYRRLHAASRWYELEGVPVRYLPYRVLGPFWNHAVMYRAAMDRVATEVHDEFPFDLIHAHTSYLDGSAGRSIARRFGVPLVITEHTGPFTVLTRHPIVRRMTERSLTAAARIIVVSNAQREAVAPHVPPDRRDRVMVIPNGVDTSLFYPAETPSVERGAPRVVFVGYFDPAKNLPLLLRAFRRVSQRLPAATLRLVGEGVQEVELRCLVDELGLSSRVTITGYQSREEVAATLRDECDVLVLPSKGETFGCVLIEALASGRPVVASRCGGPEDIVGESFVGTLVEKDSVEALAGGILEVVDRFSEYSVPRIRAYAEERFSYRVVTGALEELYREVLAAPRCHVSASLPN